MTDVPSDVPQAAGVPGASIAVSPWSALGTAGAAQVFALAVAMVTLTITARWLGPEGRGTISASLGWGTLFAAVGGLSLGPVAQHRATQGRGADWLAGLLEHLLTMAGIVTIVSWIAIAALYAVTNGSAFGQLGPSTLFVAALAIPFAIWEQYGGALLTASGDVPAYSRAIIVGRGLGLVLVFAAFLARARVEVVVLTTVAAQATVAALVFRAVARDRTLTWPTSTQELRRLVADGGRLHLNYVGGYLVGNSGVLVVNYFLGTGPTGIYQMALQLASVPGVLSQAAAMVMSGLVAGLGPDAAWPVQRRLLLQVMAFLSVALPVGGLLAGHVVPYLFGANFAHAVPLLRWLLVPALLGSFVTMLTPQWVGRGLFMTISLLSLVAGALVLGLTIALVPRMGAMGAVAASIAVYATSAIAQLALLRRKLGHV